MKLESIRVAEGDFGQRCASARIVDYVFDYTTDIAMFFGEIICPELCWSLVQASMGRCIFVSPYSFRSVYSDRVWKHTEDGPATLPLVADDTTHRLSLLYDERWFLFGRDC